MNAFQSRIYTSSQRYCRLPGEEVALTIFAVFVVDLNPLVSVQWLHLSPDI